MSMNTLSLNVSSRVSLLTSETSILILASAIFLATSSFIFRPAPPASAARSFTSEIVLGRLSVISSRAPVYPFFGSGLAAAGAGFLAPAAALGSLKIEVSRGLGSSPSI